MINIFKNIKFYLLLLLIASISDVSGQTEVKERQKVGLVLSGGGAKGFAHVGVLKILEQYDIPIDYICGTSIGAIIGGLYAVGYTSEQLEDMVLSQDWEALFINEPNRIYMPFYEKEAKDRYLITMELIEGKFQLPNYAIDNDGIIKLFSDLTIGYHNIGSFDDLPIPFQCVAVDFLTGKEVVLNSGSLAEAMGASMALPGIFPSVKKDSAVYIDGGVLNNFPVDHVREMGADIVIGIDIGAGMLSRDRLETFGGVMDQLTTMIAKDKYNLNVPNCDLFIRPDIDAYTPMDFSHEAAIELLAVGEQAGHQHEEAFKELEKEFEPYEITRVEPYEYLDTILSNYIVTSYDIEGTKLSDDVVLAIMGIDKYTDNVISLDMVELGLKRLHASSKFANIRYELYDDTVAGNYILALSLDDYSSSTVNFGAHYNTQESVALLLNSTFNTLFLRGSRISTDLKIAANPRFNFSYNINRGSLPGLGVEYEYNSRLMKSYEDGENVGQVHINKHSFDVNTNSVINKHLTVGLGARYENFSTTDKVGIAPIENGRYDYLLYQFFFKLDNRDDAYYSSQGGNYSLTAKAVTDNGYSLGGDIPSIVIHLSMKHFFSLNKIWTISPSFTAQVQFDPNRALPVFYDTYAGGVAQLNGIVSQVPFWGLHWSEYRAHNLLAIGLENRFQVAAKHYVYGNFNVMSIDESITAFAWDNINYHVGGAIGYSYDSLVGPVDAYISMGNAKQVFIYLGIGYYF